jgi:hypothetical protein
MERFNNEYDHAGDTRPVFFCVGAIVPDSARNTGRNATDASWNKTAADACSDASNAIYNTA